MGVLDKVNKFLFDPSARFNYLDSKGCYDSLDDEAYLKKAFKAHMGYELDLYNPQTFNEKLQWLKLHNRKPEYTMMADKYVVRQYIANTIGEEYLIPLIGVWGDPDDIDFDKLPNQFVLKCNHNSGTGMCICKDKSKLDYEAVRDGLRKGLKEDYYLKGREWPYKDIDRKIVCEKFMQDKDNPVLNDYKILCFDGEPKLIELHRNRFTEKQTQDFYDTDWNLTSISQDGSMAKSSTQKAEKPKNLNKMLKFAKLLSKDIPHLRVDFYEINGKVYFGELTFFDGSGFDSFDNIEYDYLLGSWITLNI